MSQGRTTDMPTINTSRAAARNAKNKSTAAPVTEPETKPNHNLEQIAVEVRAIWKKNTKNNVLLGKLLQQAADQSEYGQYKEWLEREFGMSDDTAMNYRNLYRLTTNPNGSGLLAMDINDGALYRLGALLLKEDLHNIEEIFKQVKDAATKGRVTYQTTTAIIEAVWVAEEDRHLAEQHRIEQLFEAYAERFGGAYGVHLDDNICRLMEAALRSGVDEPELVQKRREAEEYRVEYERKHAEFLVTPITAETEQEYTGRIKNRKLYDGACELAWEQYFIFRDQHPECEPLT